MFFKVLEPKKLKNFISRQLQETYQSFIRSVLQGPQSEHNTTLSKENIRSKLATWPQIASIYMKEIDTLQQRINTLFLTLPKPHHPNNKTPDKHHYAETEAYTPEDLIKLPDIQTSGQRFKTLFQQVALPRSSGPQAPEHKRSKRFIPLIVAGIAGALASATAGTAWKRYPKRSTKCNSKTTRL